jgi:predicted nucleic acid-binding protein
MADYLLDTNILLRASDPQSEQYSLADEAVYHLLEEGHQCLLTSQILIEFWVVATRPVEGNGFGWTPERTKTQIDEFPSQFTLLKEPPDLFSFWFQLVNDHNIKGKRTHDIRILAVMKAYAISHILTFNPNDFIPIDGITIVHPQEIMPI